MTPGRGNASTCRRGIRRAMISANESSIRKSTRSATGWRACTFRPCSPNAATVFGGALLNVPSAIRSSSTVRDSPLAELSDTVIWISTRLPLHEKSKDTNAGTGRRVIDISESELEKRVLAGFEPYFETCSRTRIALSTAIALDTYARPYRICNFNEFKGGLLTKHGSAESRLRAPHADRSTIGYLVALPPQEGLGRLIAAFGPGGTETLLFGLLLATEFRERIKEILRHPKPRLFLARFFVPEYVPSPLLSYPRDELGAVVLADQALPSSSD